MRFDTVPDLHPSEFGWIVMGLTEPDGLACLRRFDSRHNRDKEVAQGLGQLGLRVMLIIGCHTDFSAWVSL
jgi:hypothetical protein